MGRKGFSQPLVIVGVIIIVIGSTALFLTKFAPENLKRKLDFKPLEENAELNPTPDYSYRDEFVKRVNTTPTPSPSLPALERTGENYTKIYKFNEFGIFSPLFEGKEVSYIIYTFNGKRVVQKHIDLTDRAGQKWKRMWVTVWEYENADSRDIENPDFAIAQGYENYGAIATTLKGQTANWKGEYVNLSGITFNYFYDGWTATNVYLDSFQSTSIRGNPIFIRVGASPVDNFAKELDNPDVLDAKKRATEIANLIQL